MINNAKISNPYVNKFRFLPICLLLIVIVAISFMITRPSYANGTSDTDNSASSNVYGENGIALLMASGGQHALTHYVVTSTNNDSDLVQVHCITKRNGTTVVEDFKVVGFGYAGYQHNETIGNGIGTRLPNSVPTDGSTYTRNCTHKNLFTGQQNTTFVTVTTDNTQSSPKSVQCKRSSTRNSNGAYSWVKCKVNDNSENYVWQVCGSSSCTSLGSSLSVTAYNSCNPGYGYMRLVSPENTTSSPSIGNAIWHYPCALMSTNWLQSGNTFY